MKHAIVMWVCVRVVHVLLCCLAWCIYYSHVLTLGLFLFAFVFASKFERYWNILLQMQICFIILWLLHKGWFSKIAWRNGEKMRHRLTWLHIKLSFFAYSIWQCIVQIRPHWRICSKKVCQFHVCTQLPLLLRQRSGRRLWRQQQQRQQRLYNTLLHSIFYTLRFSTNLRGERTAAAAA